MIVVSEPGVYRLVFRSRKPEAERFKRWLAHDVLPQIRRTGGYQVDLPATVLPTAPEDAQSRALALVTECRLIHGRAAAARLWLQLGLPSIPPDPPAVADAGARACLAHLLAAPLGDSTVGALLAAAFRGATPAAKALWDVRIRLQGDGFLVPSINPAFAALFDGTPWPRPFEHLRRLPGAKPCNPLGGAKAGEATYLPSVWIDG